MKWNLLDHTVGVGVAYMWLANAILGNGGGMFWWGLALLANAYLTDRYKDFKG